MKSLRTPRKSTYVIGVDFGTLSARAVLVSVANGEVCASAVEAYPHGVMEERLAVDNKALPPQTALQDPSDYLYVLKKTIRKVLRQSKVLSKDVVGLGTDFTCSTVLPTDGAGEPLCTKEEFRREPHAYVKLWKHHASQPEADAINALAAQRGEDFIGAYGGRYSSEWLFSKVLETVRKAPRVHQAAARWIEAGDWIVWQLTGCENRGVSASGFKAMRVVDRTGTNYADYPSSEFFSELHPALTGVVESHLTAPHLAPGKCAGHLTPAFAKCLGLPAGLPVAVGNIDAHAAIPACGVGEPGRMVMIMGTSSCHLLLAKQGRRIPGVCGVVREGVMPGLWAYEAGQAGVGDMLSWFVENSLPAEVFAAARRHTSGVHGVLSDRAAQLKVGQSGLLALDWWNGNRSVLMDADLSGLLVGLTIQTKPHEIYRALVEGMAFGTRKIIEAFTSQKIQVREVVACGGLASKNPFILQVYADVIGRPIHLAAATEASALGAAIFAAVSGGVYRNFKSAIQTMTQPPIQVFTPDPQRHRQYELLYKEYTRLHDFFGATTDSTMKRLRTMQRAAI
ncbi:MAG: ribulokinase [Pedosphaera sp.]|nr:ribulokinase [Pedosphaera sp.]